MKTILSASVLALTLATGGAVMAQTATSPATPPAAKAPTVTMDPAAEAKFKAADKTGKGVIEGAALDPYKADMAKIDTDKDGKISRAEFAAAHKAGVIK